MFDYLASASQCRTQNEFNRLHIDLENILTPGEIAAIARLSSLPQAGIDWLGGIGEHSPELIAAPQPFERRPLTSQVMFYENRGAAIGDKSLLVAFCGNARRLMVPASVFLQFVDARAWNVIVVRKGWGTTYLRGLDGVATDFAGVVRYFERAAHPEQYLRTMTFGTSGGGLAAVLAAVLMGASRGISIGGKLPEADPGPMPSARAGQDFRLVYGADCRHDYETAISMLNVFGGRLHPVSGIDHHNVLATLWAQRRLGDFLAEMLA